MVREKRSHRCVVDCRRAKQNASERSGIGNDDAQEVRDAHRDASEKDTVKRCRAARVPVSGAQDEQEDERDGDDAAYKDARPEPGRVQECEEKHPDECKQSFFSAFPMPHTTSCERRRIKTCLYA